jgi:hypothetical protein
MKAQIAWLCLQSTSSKVFTITLHEELADELRAKDADPKAYLRDRLVRCLRDEFDCVPWFQFVMEDRSRTGRNVKVHAHGAIQILACEPRRLKNGGYALRARTLIARDGLEAARMKAGEEATFQAMLNASGNGGDRPSLFRGRSQARNVWWRRPIKPFFNKEWVSYFFKNASKVSDVLPDNRLAMCRTLNQEAQRLWALIRNGEAAIEAWPSD